MALPSDEKFVGQPAEQTHACFRLWARRYMLSTITLPDHIAGIYWVSIAGAPYLELTIKYAASEPALWYQADERSTGGYCASMRVSPGLHPEKPILPSKGPADAHARVHMLHLDIDESSTAWSMTTALWKADVIPYQTPRRPHSRGSAMAQVIRRHAEDRSQHISRLLPDIPSRRLAAAYTSIDHGHARVTCCRSTSSIDKSRPCHRHECPAYRRRARTISKWTRLLVEAGSRDHSGQGRPHAIGDCREMEVVEELADYIYEAESRALQAQGQEDV